MVIEREENKLIPIYGEGGCHQCGSVWQLNKSGNSTQDQPPIFCHHASNVAGGKLRSEFFDCRERTVSYPALGRLGTKSALGNSKPTHSRVGEITLHSLRKDKP